jgi:type 1 glutamine amidotransferase
MRALLAALAAAAVVCAEYVPLRELTTEEKHRVDAVLPKKAAVKPKKPRKLLVVHMTRRNGQPIGGHESIPFGNYALSAMGRNTGAYEVTIRNDEEAFRPENLRQYDAICFNNTVGVLFEDPGLRQSLLDFVRDGKGFVGFHAAAATFVQYPKYDQFPEYGEMLGGYEDGGHPWKHTETTHIKVDDPKHPVNAAFRGQGFKIQDEAFQFREPMMRDRLRVLLSIDASKMDTGAARRILKQRQQDLDFPVSWVKTYGKGRVFYTTMGHNPAAFQKAPLLEHFLAGIQFALGDLKADATPSAQAVSRR